MFAQNENEKNLSSVGELLKSMREKSAMNIEMVSRKTGISNEFIYCIENGKWDKLPGDIYVRNFLKEYCKIFQLDPLPVLKQYEQEERIHHMVKKVDIEAFGKKNENKKIKLSKFSISLIIKNVIIFFIIMAFLFFLGQKINKIISPPEITIFSPQDNLVTDKNFVQVSGQAEVGSLILINGQTIMIDKEGKFDEQINLQFGLNTIKISASKKYSKTADYYREIMVKEVD